MTRRVFWSLPVIILSLAGILFSFMLAEEFYFGAVSLEPGERLAVFGQVSSGMCGDGFSFMSCSTVSESKYSTILDIPVAVYGLFFYTVLFFLAFPVFFASEKLRPAVAVAFFWTTAVGALLDIVLLLISIIAIDAVCPLCLIIYILNWLLLGGAVLCLRQYRTHPFRLIHTFKIIYMPAMVLSLVKSLAATVIIILAAAGLSLGTGHYLKTKLKNHEIQKKNNERERAIEKIIKRFFKEKEMDIKILPMMIIGKPDAPVTIYEFSDFLCPYCSKAAAVIEELVHDNPSTLNVVFINYPLDKVCNRFIKRAMHRGACLLALGAVCAADQDMFDKYQKTVFPMKLKHADRKILKHIATLSGLAVPQFEQCMDDPEARGQVMSDIHKARSYGVKGTPILFINKKRYRGKIRKNILQRIIDMELKDMGKKR